jgi:hypothetical protein
MKTRTKTKQGVQVIVFSPKQQPRVALLEGDSLPALQALVGGYLQAVPHSRWVPRGGTASQQILFCDEEGRMKEGMVAHAPEGLGLVEPLLGTLVLAREKAGATVSVNKADIAQYVKGAA